MMFGKRKSVNQISCKGAAAPQRYSSSACLLLLLLLVLQLQRIDNEAVDVGNLFNLAEGGEGVSKGKRGKDKERKMEKQTKVKGVSKLSDKQ